MSGPISDDGAVLAVSGGCRPADWTPLSILRPPEVLTESEAGRGGGGAEGL
jgi:hypothetical protein